MVTSAALILAPSAFLRCDWSALTGAASGLVDPGGVSQEGFLIFSGRFSVDFVPFIPGSYCFSTLGSFQILLEYY